MKRRAIKQQQIYDRIIRLTDKKNYGICPPCMDAQVALDELCRYFLGDHYYIALPLPAKQANTQIVYDIEMNYKGHNMNTLTEPQK